MQNQLKKNLHFFTDAFPFGEGEQFIKNELEIIAPNFNKVFIYPIRHNSQDKCRIIPSNAMVVITEKASLRSKDRLQLIFIFLFEYLGNLRAYNSFKKVKRLYALLKENFKIAARLKHSNELSANDVFYSYWMFDWSVVLAILKQNGKIENFYCRVHGGDLYDERRPIGKQPYRKFVMRNVTSVFSVSKLGKEYLSKAFPRFASKVNCLPLGTTEAGINPGYSDRYRIVSCASVIPLKRIDLIIELLKRIENINIEWIHFGEGSLLPAIKDKSRLLPKNVQAHFMGNVANAEILRFYAENHVSFFISMSETEGVPYSFMEAISFGVPILSTNVGGVSDLVDFNTGLLISSPPDFHDAESCVYKLLQDEWSGIERRKLIKSIWATKFSASKNYSELLHHLK